MRQTLPLGGHHMYDRLVASRLRHFYEQLAAEAPSGALLDLGCGPGHMVAAIAAHRPDVMGIDLDPAQIKIARRNHPGLRFRQGDAADLPLDDASIDWIISTESVHHWGDLAGACKEIRRVLRPGGRWLIVEGAGDMDKAEVQAWLGRRPLPGFTWLSRRVFTKHGYTKTALEEELLPALAESPLQVAGVERRDGWWIVTCGLSD